MSDNPSGEAFVWSGSELLLTHCRHGLDLRLNPRCYLCAPPSDPAAPLREALRALIAPTLSKGNEAHPIDQAWAESIRAALAKSPR